MEERSLQGKVVVVTGGATGIGAAYVHAFAGAGANVVIADVQDEPGERLAQGLTSVDSKALYIHTDVSNEQDVAAMAGRALDEFDGVNVLVNNAALYLMLERKRPFDEIPLDEWDHMMAVNVRGTWLCTKAVVGAMKDAGGGKIINIASAVFHAGVPYFAHYSASKGAVIGLTRSLARELGPYGINVNAIAPGLVSNESSRKVNPAEYLDRAAEGRALSRHMQEDDLLGTVLFLASKESDFITGQTFIVDGGSMMQ